MVHSRFAVLLATAGCGVLPDRGLSGPANRVVLEGFNAPPRTRFGGYAAAIPGMTFLGRDLGSHDYYWPFFEKNGIAYTCRGGHIDVVHLRIGVDWTAYLTAESYKHLMRKDPGFSCKMPVDRSRSYVRDHLPARVGLPLRRGPLGHRREDGPGHRPLPDVHDGDLARDHHLVRLQVHGDSRGVRFGVQLGGLLFEPAGHGHRGAGPPGHEALLQRGRDNRHRRGNAETRHPAVGPRGPRGQQVHERPVVHGHLRPVHRHEETELRYRARRWVRHADARARTCRNAPTPSRSRIRFPPWTS